MIAPEAALAALRARGDPAKAAAAAAYHKARRVYLGIGLADLEPFVAEWRAGASVAERVALAAALWDSDLHEARIAAAKLLIQARIRDDERRVWAELERWVPAFDAWAIADHASKAIERRLVAAPARLDAVEAWTAAPSLWMRRAALVATLPWARLAHPDAAERAARERVLGWAAGLVADCDRLIQKAVGAWLCTLGARDPERVRMFLAGPGAGLAGFARREALGRLRGGQASE